MGQDARGGRLALVPVGRNAPRPAAAPAGNRGTVRHYRYIVGDGASVFSATIIWENIKGLGAISGTITYPDSVVSFSGRNPESGYITFTASDGAIYSLWRRQRGNSFEWAGTGADNAAPFQVTLVPAAPAPAPAVGGGDTVRQYTMTGPFGQRFPATLIWSNIKGLGAIRGSLFTPDANLAVNGQNSRSGFIYFTDENGTYYELTKQNPVGGKVRWAGSARFNDGSTRGVELLGN